MGYILERPMEEGTWRGITHLFRVVDLPDEGLPTRPMSGSRGIADVCKRKNKETWVSTRVVAQCVGVGVGVVV